MPDQQSFSDENHPKPAPRRLTEHDRYERNGWIGLIATLVISAVSAIIWMVRHQR